MYQDLEELQLTQLLQQCQLELKLVDPEHKEELRHLSKLQEVQIKLD
jgi:hypothetical protein